MVTRWLTQNYPATAVRDEDCSESLIQNGNWDLVADPLGDPQRRQLSADRLRSWRASVRQRRIRTAGLGMASGVAKLGDYPGVNGRDKWRAVVAGRAGLSQWRRMSTASSAGRARAAAIKAFQKDCTPAADRRGRQASARDKLCTQVEEKGDTAAGATVATDHGLMELPPEKRTSTTASKTGARV